MKIAVIGMGKVGGTLGQRWRAAGHDVAYGSRTGSGDGPGGAAVMPVSEAVGGADVVVLAVPGGAVAEIVAAHGAALAGTPTPGRLPRNSSARWAWKRSSSATLRRAARWMPWCPCGSPWSGATAGTAASRYASYGNRHAVVHGLADTA